MEEAANLARKIIVVLLGTLEVNIESQECPAHEYFFRRFYFLVADSRVGAPKRRGGQGTPHLGVIRRLRRPPPPGSDPLAGLFAGLKLAQPRKMPREEPRKKKLPRKNPYSDTQIIPSSLRQFWHGHIRNTLFR